jgi:N-acetyl-anhydromuramyl-L-alanine amidase AmpD
LQKTDYIFYGSNTLTTLTDEEGVLWIPSPNYFPGRSGHKPRWLIIHGTAGFTSAEEVGYYFQRAEVATHYTIGLDGVVVQSVRESEGAWGNGYVTEGHDPWWSPALNPNLVTISIEHVKLSRDNSDEITEPQKQASFLLVQHICQRHAIPARPADESGGITGHCSMDPVSRDFCPGPYPWEELFAYLASFSE